MEHLEIPVLYRGEEYCFPARLLVRGYTHQFRVEVAGVEVVFESDEEGQYRGMIEAIPPVGKALPEVGLLEAIAQVLESAARQ